MSMKYAVLGLLVERRGYAYDLARRFEETVGPAFNVHYGAIYQALDALERDALIRGALREGDLRNDRRRRAGPRMVYETTDEGVQAYEAWIRTPARVEPLRGELALKVALSRPEHGEALLSLIDDYELACLERLREHSAAAAEQAASANGSNAWRLSSTAIARERATRLLNAEIEWVRDLRRSVAELGGDTRG